MHRDPRLPQRNAFVLPGGLLLLHGLLGLFAVFALELGNPQCQAPGQFLLGETCHTAWKWLAAALVLGLVLVLTGALAFRARPTTLQAHLLPGTGVHLGLALLGGLAVLPALLGAIGYLQDRTSGQVARVVIGGVEYAQWKLSLLVAGVGFLMLVPYLMLYLHELGLRRRFLKEALAEGDEEPETRSPWPRQDEAPQEPVRSLTDLLVRRPRGVQDAGGRPQTAAIAGAGDLPERGPLHDLTDEGPAGPEDLAQPGTPGRWDPDGRAREGPPEVRVPEVSPDVEAGPAPLRREDGPGPWEVPAHMEGAPAPLVALGRLSETERLGYLATLEEAGCTAWDGTGTCGAQEGEAHTCLRAQ